MPNEPSKRSYSPQRKGSWKPPTSFKGSPAISNIFRHDEVIAFVEQLSELRTVGAKVFKNIQCSTHASFRRAAVSLANSQLALPLNELDLRSISSAQQRYSIRPLKRSDALGNV
jgi:hypothetical protein